jgi:hypothetical protein
MFDGRAFGRFSDELRRWLLPCCRCPLYAARVQTFTPNRLVGWMQDELERFKTAQSKEWKKAGKFGEWPRFTRHDFRRTAITGLQMAGVVEKHVSIMVGATPEVIRKHYERLDQTVIARRSVEKRLGIAGVDSAKVKMSEALCAGCAQGVDKRGAMTQVGTA